jgi:blue copper oxidase
LQSTLSRRQFAIGTAAVVSGGVVGGLAGRGLAQSESVRFNRRLPIPPLIDAAEQGNAVKLRVTSGRHAFVKSKPTKSYGYSGPVLGPTVRLRRGDEVEMTVENALDVDTTVHWHGLLVPGDVDGGPHQVIKSGSTWRPRFKIEQPASTGWFHPHLHHDTARQVYMGLTGLIIVDDGSDARPGLPRTYGIDDLPIILSRSGVRFRRIAFIRSRSRPPHHPVWPPGRHHYRQRRNRPCRQGSRRVGAAANS